MTNRIGSSVSITAVFAMSVALSAQQLPPASPAPVASAHPQSVKVTGCVEGASTTVASAPTGSAASSDMFLLTKAVVEPPAIAPSASSQRPSAPAVRPAATGAADTLKAATYRLDGDAAMIAPHVGHKVEVSGEIVEVLPPATGGPTPSTSGPAVTPPAVTTPSAAKAENTPVVPRLRVIELKMISATCS